MKQLTVLAVGAVALAVLNPAPAQALATTTFVSGFGFDTNPCTVAAPCRSFQHAHDLTAAGGQITMLDPAGYGDVTITKTISIVNDGGGEAGITDPGASTNAITINAGASDVVNLRGLTLNGVGTGNNGIAFNTGGALNIQNCVIRDFANNGVLVSLGASSAVTITDTIVSNNSNDGVGMTSTGGALTAYLARVTAIGNRNTGYSFTAGLTGTLEGAIVASVAVGNALSGFANQAAGVTLAVIDAKATNNGVGVRATGGTTYLSQTTLAGNVTDGYSISGSGTLKTFGDNYIVDTTNTGTLTPIAAQ